MSNKPFIADDLSAPTMKRGATSATGALAVWNSKPRIYIAISTFLPLIGGADANDGAEPASSRKGLCRYGRYFSSSGKLAARGKHKGRPRNPCRRAAPARTRALASLFTAILVSAGNADDELDAMAASPAI